MSVYTVGYDLRKPGRNYSGLYRALSSCTNCHALESMWFIDSSISTAQIRDHLTCPQGLYQVLC